MKQYPYKGEKFTIQQEDNKWEWIVSKGQDEGRITIRGSTDEEYFLVLKIPPNTIFVRGKMSDPKTATDAACQAILDHRDGSPTEPDLTPKLAKAMNDFIDSLE